MNKTYGLMCKGCGLEIHLGNHTLKDFRDRHLPNVQRTNIEHLEFIYKTGYCMGCLVERGFCD